MRMSKQDSRGRHPFCLLCGPWDAICPGHVSIPGSCEHCAHLSIKTCRCRLARLEDCNHGLQTTVCVLATSYCATEGEECVHSDLYRRLMASALVVVPFGHLHKAVPWWVSLLRLIPTNYGHCQVSVPMTCILAQRPLRHTALLTTGEKMGAILAQKVVITNAPCTDAAIYKGRPVNGLWGPFAPFEGES